MQSLACPHCSGTPKTSLLRFLPWNSFARREFTCNLCGGISLFPIKARVPAIVSGLALAAITVIAIHLGVSSSPTGRLSFSILEFAALFLSYLILWNLISALTLRFFTDKLLPLIPGDS